MRKLLLYSIIIVIGLFPMSGIAMHDDCDSADTLACIVANDQMCAFCFGKLDLSAEDVIESSCGCSFHHQCAQKNVSRCLRQHNCSLFFLVRQY